MQGPADGGKNTPDLFVIRRMIVLCAAHLSPKAKIVDIVSTEEFVIPRYSG